MVKPGCDVMCQFWVGCQAAFSFVFTTVIEKMLALMNYSHCLSLDNQPCVEILLDLSAGALTELHCCLFHKSGLQALLTDSHFSLVIIMSSKLNGNIHPCTPEQHIDVFSDLKPISAGCHHVSKTITNCCLKINQFF